MGRRHRPPTVPMTAPAAPAPARANPVHIQRVIKGNIQREQLVALMANPQADISAKKTFYKPTQKKAVNMNSKTIYLAGGCFWGLEA